MGIPQIHAEEIADRWKEYIEGLYESEELSDGVTEEVVLAGIEGLRDKILEAEKK